MVTRGYGAYIRGPEAQRIGSTEKAELKGGSVGNRIVGWGIHFRSRVSGDRVSGTGLQVRVRVRVLNLYLVLNT